MQDRGAKATVLAMIVVATTGLSMHICWGMAKLTQYGEWTKAVFAFATFMAAWGNMILHCSRLPGYKQLSFAESVRLFSRVAWPFSIPSVITLAMLALSGPMNLQSLFIMIWGLTLIFLMPAIIRMCICIHQRRVGI